MAKITGDDAVKRAFSSSSNVRWRWFLCISAFALLIRAAVSIHGYSGAGMPPRFGDFEAQRHWMEITTNLPIREWYRNSTMNDLSYWGLDYPPLSAYQSYVHGIFIRTFNPESVALFISRGYESYIGKLLMRWTVLASDALIFFPAAIYFGLVYHRTRPRNGESNWAWHIGMILLNPCLILIDHGHFQYNCISLGFTLGAVATVLAENELLSCLLFSLALSHKQMSAYFAPAFFSHLLGKCLRRKRPLLAVSKLGLAVIVTFVVVWWPYLHSVNDFLRVLSRLAPFDRGIYEDYVANFWCTTSVLIKWKRLFATQSLKLMSLAATILACLPSMIQQILAPSDEGFLYSLLNSSMAFYLFSFQVHEKSILLPLLPATLLALKMPSHLKNLTFYGLFSMFPLLCRDKLLLPYIAISSLFFLLYHAPGSPNGKNDTTIQSFPSTLDSLVSILSKARLLFSLILHVVYLKVKPPQKYPFLFEALIMLLSFSYYIQFALNTNHTQYMSWRRIRSENQEKRKCLTSDDKEKKLL